MVSDVEVEEHDREARKRSRALSLEDCRCPVCLEILLEPVTLPCTHTFCKVCFLEAVDKAALCCPLCRRRVSTWARLNSRKNSLVDQTLWEQIQTCFPLQCQRRLTGEDEEEEEEEQPGVPMCFPRVSQPGELKQEYEDQVTKLMEEKRFHEEEERKASEDFIQRLLAEEDKLRQEETRRREGDEKLARLLSSQLNSAPVSHVTPAKKKRKEVGGGQMEKFLFPLPSSNVSSSSSFISNKENILFRVEQQVEQQVERPPPTLDYYGQTDGPAVDLHLQVPAEGSSELETLEGGTSWLCPSSPEEVKVASIGVAGLEAELLCRQRQEEEDRRLALLLQKELDREEKQRATNRRRGSSEPYLLRHHSRREMKAASCDPPTRPSRKTTKTSSPPSSSTKTKDASSSSNSSTKQTTLMEMFSFRAAENSSPSSQ